MKQKNEDLLKKFEVMKNWMCEDIKRSMFDARANFLVAQGLLNYTEIIGSFIKPDSVSGEKFDAFFKKMGPEYEKLLKRFNNRRKKRPHIVYDDLRCGLTHEYTIKRKGFTIYNPKTQLSDDQMNNVHITINGVNTQCRSGLMYSNPARGKGMWHFINPKYYLDFKNALEDYWQELNINKNKVLRKSFFKRARQINFIEFKVL